MNDKDLNKSFYTIQEFAEKIRAHHNTVRKSIKKGYITAFRIGSGSRSSWRIPTSEIERMALFNLESIIEKKVNERMK